jgi:hypothetical protein
MKQILFYIILIFSLVLGTKAQDTGDLQISRNGAYAELYMLRHDFSDGVVSINYERNIGKKRRANLRVGIYPDFESTVSFPLTISWITKPMAKHHFEYGIGAVIRIEHYVDPYFENPKEWFYDFPAILFPIMYRYQKKDGLYFRGGINLFVSWPTLPSPSFSIGYRF